MSFKKYLNTYEFETTLPGNGQVVKFKPIKTKHMKKLLTYENSSSASTIEDAIDDVIFGDCVISEDFDIMDMYMQDRFFLLLQIRMKTRGESYTFDFQCPNCKSQSIQKVQLDKLPVKPYNKKPMEKKNPKVKVTESEEKPEKDVVKITDKISVRLDHPKRRDQHEAFETMNSLEGLTENQRNAEIATLTYAKSIKSVITPDGEEILGDDRIEDKLELLDNISQEEYEKILGWFEKNDFGVEFKMKIRCPHCDYSKTEDIPMDNFFF